jgi:hypothetical protein
MSDLTAMVGTTVTPRRHTHPHHRLWIAGVLVASRCRGFVLDHGQAPAPS